LTTLVIDTCLGACQVAVVRAGRLLAARSELMQRGHQERLAVMTQDVVGEAGLRFDKLERIAVTIGPGSFTGLRVGLAFAKGLALATGAPLVGMGTLQALAASADDGRTAGVIDARRGQVYAQAFEAGRPLDPPQVLPFDVAAARLRELAVLAIGPGAGLFAETLGVGRTLEIAAPDLDVLARLAEAAPAGDEVRPLYLRAPDAKLPG